MANQFEFLAVSKLWSRGVARWCRWNLSVADPFVCRCLTSSTMLPFPHPAHRTGRADLPHPALGEDSRNRRGHCMRRRLQLLETTWELSGLSPISLPVAASCVRLQLRSLPSTGITRLRRYYEPLRHPKAPGLSLAGVRLVSSLTTPWGFPCFVRFPCVHAAATTPAQRLGVLLRSFTQPYQPSPKGLSGRPAHCPFRGLLGVYSRYGLHTRAVTVYRDTLTEGFSHFVTSMTAPVAPGWSIRRVGLTPTGKRRLSTAHTQVGHRAVAVSAGSPALVVDPRDWA